MKTEFEHQFVKSFPAKLQEKTLYISMEFATVGHLCACGCKNLVITPIEPTEWSMLFDGVSISLSPSIGNWNFPCRSHYWIKRNAIVWSSNWSDLEIKSGRLADKKSKESRFRLEPQIADSTKNKAVVQDEPTQRISDLFKKFIRKVFGNGPT